MNISVIRTSFTEKYTEGKLYINNEYFCDTLEDTDRGLKNSMQEEEILLKKVYGETCIPYGTYRLTIEWSNKFKKFLISINNVKGFAGVKIHSLNTAEQSLGCIGVGKKSGNGFISESRATYVKLHQKVESELKNRKDVWLEVKKL